jgi:myosin-1
MLIFRSIEYNKKPGKVVVIKGLKDPKLPQRPPGEVIYKSGTIHANDGEPASSASKPTPRPKQVAGRPITKGKLLRPGGPGGGPSKLASRPAQSRPVNTSTSQSKPLPQPLAALNGSSHGLANSSQNMRAPPPPPPPAPTAVQDPTCRALWDFAGQTAGEMSVKKGEVVIIVRKEPNGKILKIEAFIVSALVNMIIGWWLARPMGSSASDTTVQGWVPSAYVEEIVNQAPPPPPPPPVASRPVPGIAAANGINGSAARPAGSKPIPPAPPAKRPAGKRPTTNSSSGESGRDSMAGSLAEALRQRQAAMSSRKKEDGW